MELFFIELFLAELFLAALFFAELFAIVCAISGCVSTKGDGCLVTCQKNPIHKISDTFR